MRTRKLLPLVVAAAMLAQLFASPAHAADTTPPTAPGQPVASDLTEFSVTLTWAPSTDDVGVAYYEVWRTYTDMVIRVGTPTTNTISVNNLPRGTVNRFNVAAYDAAGNRSPSSPTLIVTTLPGDLEPPGPVFGVTASEITDTSARLTWAGAMWGEVANFRVHVGRSGVPFTVVATIPFGTRTHVITGLSPGTQYLLGISAVDPAGNSSGVSAIPVTTTGLPPAPTCTVSYRVTSQWGGAFNADVRVTNNTSAAVSGWTLRWTYAGTQRIGHMWNGAFTQTGQAVTVTNLAYNGTIDAGASQSFGFQAGFSGTNTNPAAFTLNGASCAVA